MSKEIKKPPVLAVDGDILAYRTAAVCEDHFAGACDEIIDSTLKQIATNTGVSTMRIYLSGKDNFRYSIAKTKPYKGNRATMVRPVYLEHCKNYLLNDYKAIMVHEAEADDGIASDMVNHGAAHCGIDKDMLQIPGLHYNYVKEEWTQVTPEDAELTLYRQVCMGDTSDNIPGLPRIGEAKAKAAITDWRKAKEQALDFYKQVCMEKLPGVDYFDYFLEQLMLIKMKTDLNLYDMMTATVEPETDGFVQHEVQEDEFVGNPVKEIQV
jgi:hypothetical protein